MSTVSPEVLALPIQERAALAMQEAFKKAVEEQVREGLNDVCLARWKSGGGTRRRVAREVLKRIYLLGIKVFWLAAQRQTPFCLIQVSVKRTR